MIKQNIKYGGDLTKGDFIIVSSGNFLQFGWYIGQGKNTIQYYSLHSVVYTNINYNNWLNNKKVYNGYKFEKNGLTLKCILKDYILESHKKRVMKYPGNPEEIFTNQEDLEKYQLSKECLEKLKFLNK